MNKPNLGGETSTQGILLNHQRKALGIYQKMKRPLRLKNW